MRKHDTSAGSGTRRTGGSVQSGQLNGSRDIPKDNGGSTSNRRKEYVQQASGTQELFPGSNKDTGVAYTNASGLCQKLPIWVALEGIDGCGKSTQVKRVVGALTDATPFRFPTDPLVIAEALETSHPLERALIFMADMVSSATLIRAIKKDGGCAVSDRSIISTYCYQSVKCMHGDFNSLDMYRQLKVPSLMPDLIVYIRIPLVEAIRRIQTRSETGVEISEFEVPEKLARTYRQMESLIAELEKQGLAVIVDGTKPMEKVTFDILKAIKER